MTIVGVDPGLKGGLAAYSVLRSELIGAWPMPVMRVRDKNRVNGAMLAELLSDALPDLVMIEIVGARPRQGVTSMFSFGRGLGVVEGVCSALRIPMEDISPQTWRGKVGLRGDKAGARALATQLFPAHARLFSRTMDDGVAEASLIALAAARTR